MDRKTSPRKQCKKTAHSIAAQYLGISSCSFIYVAVVKYHEKKQLKVGRVDVLPKVQSIAGKSEWQKPETVGQVASISDSREKTAPMFPASLLAFFTFHSSEISLGNGATHSGLGFPISINIIKRVSHQPT